MLLLYLCRLNLRPLNPGFCRERDNLRVSFYSVRIQYLVNIVVLFEVIQNESMFFVACSWGWQDSQVFEETYLFSLTSRGRAE